MWRRMLFPLLALLLILQACGDTADVSTPPADSMGDMSSQPMGDDEMMDMNMGDAGATPAYEVVPAEMAMAPFELLDSRPPGYDDVTGIAWIARHDMGTTVTLELTALDPGVDYIAHVHEGLCADAGGDHFKFDPSGSDVPPNEIHLAFTSDASGKGFMTAENHAVAGTNARSVVVHPADLLDNKLACAEF